jgi:hypothetical protein
MSHITTSKTAYTDRAMLEVAIMDLLLTKDKEPITSEHFLTGTATDRNGTKINCEFYISRQVLGTNYGDIGFRLDNEGTYEFIADTGYDYLRIKDKEKAVSIEEFRKRLNARYAAQKIEAAIPELEAAGRTVEKVMMEDGGFKYYVKEASYAY